MKIKIKRKSVWQRNKKRIVIISITCMLAFFIGALLTIVLLNNESYEENSRVYVLESVEKITEDNSNIDGGIDIDNMYKISYYDVALESDNRTVSNDIVDIYEFLDPETDSIKTSYFREYIKKDNSFLNSIFHYNDKEIIERRYYLSPLDRLRLKENNTTKISN